MLIHLDNTARTSDHAVKDNYSYILQRFIHNKALSNVGMLVACMLSSKMESAIMERENKLKSHSGHVGGSARSTQNAMWANQGAGFYYTPSNILIPKHPVPCHIVCHSSREKCGR